MNDPRFRRRRHAVLLLVGCILLTGAGCVTEKQVTDIVNRSNATLLQATTLGQTPLRLSTTAEDDDGWQAEVARIDEFIEGHGDQPKLVNALRLRQAMILTIYKQDNLARTMFSLITCRDLAPRDEALCELSDELIWWYSKSTSIHTATDVENANAMLSSFTTKLDRLALAEESEIHRFLEEMRAWMALAIARAQTNEDEVRKMLVDGLDRFAGVVGDEVAWIAEHSEDLASAPVAAPRILRLRLRTIELVREYQKKAEDVQGWQAELASTTQQLIEAVK